MLQDCQFTKTNDDTALRVVYQGKVNVGGRKMSDIQVPKKCIVLSKKKLVRLYPTEVQKDLKS